jgi:hypothetical protein
MILLVIGGVLLALILTVLLAVAAVWNLSVQQG